MLVAHGHVPQAIELQPGNMNLTAGDSFPDGMYQVFCVSAGTIVVSFDGYADENIYMDDGWTFTCRGYDLITITDGIYHAVV